jgi:hypothetical protein
MLVSFLCHNPLWGRPWQEVLRVNSLAAPATLAATFTATLAAALED